MSLLKLVIRNILYIVKYIGIYALSNVLLYLFFPPTLQNAVVMTQKRNFIQHTYELLTVNRYFLDF